MSALSIRQYAWLGSGILAVTLILLINQPITPTSACYTTLVFDQLGHYCKLTLVASTICTLIMSCEYFRVEKTTPFESIVLVLLATSSMLFLISANDLITIYLAIELQSLCFYVIAASKRTSEFSTEAGLKYFLLGAFSSGILLFGCSMIYGFTGTTNCEQLAQLLTGDSSLTSSGVFLGILFVAVGFLFKITAVPFHMWAPDVYEGSPTYVTAFFATAPKIALLAIMLRLFMVSFYDPTWQQLFVVCSMASMILGSVAGLAQTKIKRLLAYSSIAHVGYLLIGLACGTIEGVQALLLGVFIYVLMTLTIFAVVLALRHQSISDWSALARTNPLLALTVSITMFSFAGIPPLAGFCSKLALFLAALACGAYLLALVGVLTSVISCFYYIRLVKVMYFDTPPMRVYSKPIDRGQSLVLAITVFLVTFLFVYPSPLFLVTHQMALNLCL